MRNKYSQMANPAAPSVTPQPLSIEESIEESFQNGEVLTIAAGHFVHDVFTGGLPSLLPLLIEKLSLSLVMAGSLSAILQIPALLNPFVGYLADRVSLRYFIIFAPAVTGTLMMVSGLMPDYTALLTLLLVTGVSSVAFHAPAPAMIGRISGGQVGKGMGFFMAAGELGRTIGPLLAVWAVSTWTLEGVWRLALAGWAASFILFLRLRHVVSRPKKPGSLLALVPAARRVFMPLLVIVVFRSFMVSSLAVYLPTFMRGEGASLLMAGGALSIYELAGVVGALASGPLSDRLGRKRVLLPAIAVAAGFMLLFLNVQGWLLVPVLAAMGITLLSTQPVMLAIVQDQLPQHRAVANGIYMLMTFVVGVGAAPVIGAVGDAFGLRVAFYGSAFAALLALPAILWLPSGAQQT
jgi:FSR family fosmidomycin resistance protein-like MFS transporter